MTVQLPPYLVASHDEEAKKLNISVDNAEEKHQRAMWGEFPTFLFQGSSQAATEAAANGF